MPYTEEQKLEIQNAMYGASREEVLESLKEEYEISGKEMLLMCMLSDVQNMIEFDQKESARQLINRVKLVLQEFELNEMDERLIQHRKRG